MAACCAVKGNSPEKNLCPVCQIKGKPVPMETLYHQVSFPNNMNIPNATFYFCAAPECTVGYFTASGIIIQKNQLREKEHIRSGWLCYCFDISQQDYHAALDTNTAEAIKQFVIAQTKTGSCACTTRNPSGQCCLADFKQFEKEQQREQR